MERPYEERQSKRGVGVEGRRKVKWKNGTILFRGCVYMTARARRQM